MTREMKDSGIAWIGEIPASWKCVKLGFLYSFSSGDTLTAQDFVDNGEYKVFGANGERGHYDKYNVDGKHILIGRVGALCGNIHLINEAVWVTEHALVSYSFSPLINDEFSAYLLMAMNLGQYSSGTAQPVISADKIRRLSIPLPELEEQITIANFLDTECARIDAVIEQTRASIEEYKKLKQAVITQAVTKGIRPNRPMKDSGENWLKAIPCDWEMVRGKGLFSEINARSEDGSEELLTVSQYTGVTPRSQKNVNMFEAETLEGYKICEIGDIAANTMWLWAGAIGVSQYRGVISPSYNIYRQTSGAYLNQYLDYLLRVTPLVQHYESLSTGIRASRLRLYPEQFLSIRFPVPPMDEQKEIVDYLASKIIEMDNLIIKKETFLTEMESYKKSLIFEYVTGKKEVNNALHRYHRKAV